MDMGKSGGGGGGSSGSVTWPTYFMQWHEALLGSDPSYVTTGGAIDSAAQSNPFTGLLAYDPTATIANMQTLIGAHHTAISTIVPATEYSDAMSAAKTAVEAYAHSTTELAAAEVAFNAVIDADYNNSALPRFQRGMQDINAVISSSFTTGAALLSAEVTRKKAQFSSELRLQSYREKTSAILSGADKIVARIAAIQQLTLTIINAEIETGRLQIVAMKEYSEATMKIEEAESKWVLDVLTSGSHILAAGQGGVGIGTAKATPLQSALGGALSGAAAGGMAGYGIAAATAAPGAAIALGPIGWGIGIGALLGGAIGLSS
jgi:hypothetical protein